MIAWEWLIGAFLLGAAIALLAVHEIALWRRTTPRAITIDIVGAPLPHPDDWFSISASPEDLVGRQ